MLRFFRGNGLLALHPTPNLEDHPLSTGRDGVFYIFVATLHPQPEESYMSSSS